MVDLHPVTKSVAYLQVYANMQVCEYKSIEGCKYASMLSMQICRYESMQVHKYASMLSMQICRYESMQVSK